jgi:type VI secretion system protein ImpE
MEARALFTAGRLDEAIDAMSAGLRRDPTDLRSRTFLFELLCFAGDYDRAEKQLDAVARSSREAELGAWLYRSALHAERVRQETFGASARIPTLDPVPPVRGHLNDTPFDSLVDADPRIGARLELFAAGQYTWIPLEHVATIQIAPPRQLRDLLWIPARVQTGPGFDGAELGEVLLPALAPLSWQHPDPAVRLGRATEWIERPDGGAVPVGQKLLLTDEVAVPILEVRTLEVLSPAPVA